MVRTDHGYPEPMPSEKQKQRITYSGRPFDRLVNFSDAVVAVAITVLALPIADLALTTDETTVWEVMGDNSGKIITFFFTFAVVGIMWMTHNRILSQLFAFDATIFWLNMAWLAAIAFLPVSSNLYGTADSDGQHGWSGGHDLSGSGLLYWGSLACVSLLGAMIAAYARRHPDLLDPEIESPSLLSRNWKVRYRGVAFAIFFLLIGVLSTIWPGSAGYLSLTLIILGRVMR